MSVLSGKGESTDGVVTERQSLAELGLAVPTRRQWVTAGAAPALILMCPGGARIEL